MPPDDTESMTVTADDVGTLDREALACADCEATRADFKGPGRCGHLDTCKHCTCKPQPKSAPVDLPILADVDIARLATYHGDPRVRACAKELLDRRGKESGKAMITGHAKTSGPAQTSTNKKNT